MLLSQALCDKIRFNIRVKPDGRKEYMPFQACVQAAFPGAAAQTFPLAFACPLFFGPDGPHTDCEAAQIVYRELPDKAKPPRKHGILFLCDAIDAMAVALEMTEAQVADVVERIESAFQAAGIDNEGRPKS
jgi:hypothetical protein